MHKLSIIMSGNKNLQAANKAKNDEFYTTNSSIQKEVNAYVEHDPNVFRGKTILLPCDDPEWSKFTEFFVNNFNEYGIKKLISTSYAINSKKAIYPQLTFDFYATTDEQNSPNYDPDKSLTNGRIFILDGDSDNNGKININDIQWKYLEGDGDFRSQEVCKLRDEADIIITNPPFSLFREFLAWIFAGKQKNNNSTKQFLIIGNMNAISYKEVFPLIKENKIWLGNSGRVPVFIKPDKSEHKMGNTCWFTNLMHSQHSEPLKLMSMADNKKFSKHKEIIEKGYLKYDNFDAIEVPFTDAIPADFDGVMGVPITFLEKYCPDQFEIVGNEYDLKIDKGRGYINGKRMYSRVFIRFKNKFKH